MMLAAVSVSCELRVTHTAQHHTMTSKSAVPVFASKVMATGHQTDKKGSSRIEHAVQKSAQVKRCSMRRFWRSKDMITTMSSTTMEAGCKWASLPT